MFKQKILHHICQNVGSSGVRRLSSISDLETSLRNTLTKRRVPILYDYLTPQSSYLLSKSLHDFLPPVLVSQSPTILPSIVHPHPLPPGHHIAYFPTPTTESQLLADGTDILHSPGPPFTRRLWAGGYIRFPPEGGPLLDAKRAVCIEGIRNVRVTGKEGDEKVFVEIERRVARVEDEDEDEDDIRQRIWTENPDDQGDAAVIERRDLVFLREQPPRGDAETPPPPPPPPRRKPLRPPSTPPEFSHTLTPTPSLLFRYSALTFNAHAIHLDPLYTRRYEHHPDLLVHGPLLLTLMLDYLRQYLLLLPSPSPPARSDPDPSSSSVHTIRAIAYRNLSPVYCNRPLTICLKRKSTSKPDMGTGHEWDVWIQQKATEDDDDDDDGGGGGGEEGEGLCVKGTVFTAPLSDAGGNHGEGWTAGLQSLEDTGLRALIESVPKMVVEAMSQKMP